jgi:hypothetical protein
MITASALLLALLVFAQAATSHHRKLFPRTYSPNSFNVHVYFDRDVPGGPTRSRILNGAREWTDQGRQLVFVGHRRSVSSSGETCQQFGGHAQSGVVHWRRIDGAEGKLLAFNRNCRWISGPKAGYLAGFKQVYDSAEPWYMSSGEAPGEETDLWSVAAHEFGHAAGWRSSHYARNDPACERFLQDPDTGQTYENLARETMCASIPPGTSYQRSLGEHDLHTFTRVYDPR